MSTVVSPASNQTASNHRKMRGWQIHAYGDTDELQFNDKIRIPAIKSPQEVLVKVEAASVNPIDVAMTSTTIITWTTQKHFD